MKPDPPTVLEGVASELLRNVLPELRTPYAQGALGLGVSLITYIAEEFDRAAARLVEEDEAMAGLLAEAADLVPHPLAQQIRDAIDAPRHADLRVSALQEGNDRMRAIYIEAQAALEALQSGEAAALNERFWTELQESTRRRHLTMRR